MKIKELLSVYTLRITAISTLLSACFFAPVLFAIRCDDCGKEIDPILPSYCKECDYKHFVEVLGQNLHRGLRHIADDYHQNMQTSRSSRPVILYVVDTSSSPVAPGQQPGISPDPQWIADNPESTPSPTTDAPPRFTRCLSHGRDSHDCLHPPAEELTRDEQVQRARVDIRSRSIQNVFTIPADQTSTPIRALTHIMEIDHEQYIQLFYVLKLALRKMATKHNLGKPTAPPETGHLDEGYQFYSASLPVHLQEAEGASATGGLQQGITQVVAVGESRHLQRRGSIQRHELHERLSSHLFQGRLTAASFTNEDLSVLMVFEGTPPEEPGGPTTHSTVRIPLLSRNYPAVPHHNIIALVDNVMVQLNIDSIDISELLTDEQLNPQEPPVVHHAPPNETEAVPVPEEVRPPELQFTLPFSSGKSPG